MYVLFERVMTLFNVTSSPQESSEVEQRRQFMSAIGVWELVICAVGTPANALVLYLAVVIARKGGAVSGGKQQWFVASMTLADLLFTCLHAPMFYALYTLGELFDGFACSLFYLCTHVSIVASSLSLLLINVDKFLALHKPLHYPGLMTPCRAGALLIGSWLVSISWAVFLVFGPFLVVRSNCGPEFKPQYVVSYYAFAVVFFALPVCVSVCIAVFVTVVSSRARRSTLLIQAGSASIRCAGAPSLLSSAGDGTGHKCKERLSNIKAITFVFTTTLWSAVTLLPYRFAFILNLLGYPSVVVQSIFLTMTTMNALGNPFITLLTQYRYRKKVKRIWRRILRQESLADNEMLAQHVAATIRLLCQQQEQLITAASRRSAKQNQRISPSDEQNTSFPKSTAQDSSESV